MIVGEGVSVAVGVNVAVSVGEARVDRVGVGSSGGSWLIWPQPARKVRNRMAKSARVKDERKKLTFESIWFGSVKHPLSTGFENPRLIGSDACRVVSGTV